MLLIEWQESDGSTTVLDWDVAPSEKFDSTATATEHAIESGAPISDGVIAGNDVITIEAVVSNTPIVAARFGMDGATMSDQTTPVTIDGKQRQVTAFQASQTFDRVHAVDEQMQRLISEGKELTIRTSLRTISSVVLVGFEVARDATAGNKSLRATMTFRKVRIVSTRRVAVTQAHRRIHQSTQNRGNQPATTPTAAQASMLRGLVNDVRRSFRGG